MMMVLILLFVAIAISIAVSSSNRNRQVRAGQHIRQVEIDGAKRLAEEDVTVFGEELQNLHIETMTTTMDTAMRQDYQRALNSYETAKERLATAQSPEQVKSVTHALEDGRVVDGEIDRLPRAVGQMAGDGDFKIGTAIAQVGGWFLTGFDGAQQFGREAQQFKSVGLLHCNRFAGVARVHGFNKGFGRRKVALHFKRVSHVGSHNNSPPLSGAPSFNG